ncbi:MAG: helix-turn-helix transcriptional regulator [Clostridia bacterium]|nr:helix-turn-helix transcriptional regulator [Clostridia bacterium]
MKIKELRKAKGLSQTAVAKALGIAQNTYSYWELGKFEPSLVDVKRLAEYFGVTVGELFGEAPQFLPAEADKPKIFHDRNMFHTSASLEEIEQSIDQDKEKLKETFFQIGYKLTLIKNTCLHKKLGYENIIDYAQDRFGFGKTTTYDLINVYARTRDFHDPIKMAKGYKKFSQSQLVAMSGEHWSADMIVNYIEPDDTVEDIKKYLKIWDREYRTRCNAPKGKNLKEALKIEQRRKEKLASEREQEQTVAPGQMQIDVETSECVGEETFVFNQEDELEEIDQEIIQNEEETSEQTDGTAEQEQATAPTFEIYPKKKFVSTPARIKGAIKDFFDSNKYFKVIFDPDDKGGGTRVVSEEIAQNIATFLVENWDEIFKDSGMGLEK